MSEPPSPIARLDVDGPAAPPRANGELCFDAPWQSRVFGITMRLCDDGRIAWEAFRERLIDEISRWDREHAGDADAEYRYWEHWLAALGRLLDERALLTPADLEARTRAYVARPHGHDHAHDPDPEARG